MPRPTACRNRRLTLPLCLNLRCGRPAAIFDTELDYSSLAERCFWNKPANNANSDPALGLLQHAENISSPVCFGASRRRTIARLHAVA